jgi:hypothetical protein
MVMFVDVEFIMGGKFVMGAPTIGAIEFVTLTTDSLLDAVVFDWCNNHPAKSKTTTITASQIHL